MPMNKKSVVNFVARALPLVLALGGAQFLPPAAIAQTVSSLDRDRGHVMLVQIREDIRKNYFDPAYHGMDLDARFKAADDKIKAATSVGQIFGIIAQALLDLDDSHTFFIPPQRAARTDYGWQMEMMGDKCYVIAVKPGSDADAKGLKPGDQVLAVDDHLVVRENLWKMHYLYYNLRPQPGMKVVVQSPDGQRRQLNLMAKVSTGKRRVDLTGEDENDFWNLVREAENEDRLSAHRYTVVDSVFIWKMPEFDLTDQGVDDMMAKVRKQKALILDLRGNPGGSVTTLTRMLGYLFDRDLKVADAKRRKDTKPMIAKTRGDKGFKGDLVVLVDSVSASSSELFARTIQLEKRGKVIGDHTAGAVMEALHHSHQTGADTVVFYGASITEADVIMPDGKSLEHAGVTRDEVLLPSAADMAAKRDPVLVRAATLVGAKLEPEKAGAMFPIEWRK